MKYIDQFTRQLNTEDDTRTLGLEIANALEPGDVVALIGDLGTGKTALTKYIAEGLGIAEEINSPTFTIVKEYRSGRLPLYHFDVYRLADEDEFFAIGGEEYFEKGACIIEWGEMIEKILPKNYIKFSFSKDEEIDDKRYIKIEFFGNSKLDL